MSLHDQACVGVPVDRTGEGIPGDSRQGPRQSGKTTLTRRLFDDRPYVSLEDPDVRELAQDDPRAFLEKYEGGAVLDEVQNCPTLFSYLQGVLDASKAMGRFVLTGSQQFGLMSGITQSLAGRLAMAQLLPFTLREVYGGRAPGVEEVLLRGFYPPVHDRGLDPSGWYANYVQTYLERDVRKMINVRELSAFQRFLRLCAGRTGQLVNLSQLGGEAGITHNTAKAWLSILEASYLVFLLQPHHANFNKRIIKTPKLYFYDTGLASWLLSVREKSQMEAHPLRGAFFENLAIAEMLKARLNRGETSNLFFWRDRAGHEVDVIVEAGARLVPVEIKADQTVTSDFFKGLEAWTDIAKPKKRESWLVYGGRESHRRGDARIVSWCALPDMGAMD